MTRISRLVIAVAVAGLVAPAVFAESMPSAKAAAAMGQLSPLGAASHAVGASTDWTTVLQTAIKTANDKELAFDVAVQCGLVTYTAVKSKGGDRDTSSASGAIYVRVKVTDDEGTVRYAGPGEGGDPEAGVIYCRRTQTLSAVFQGLIEQCIDPELGTIDINDECLEPEEVSLLLDSLNANAFNYLLANVPPGVHTIEVQARAETSEPDFFDDGSSKSSGEAFVGLGSMHVESVRLVNGTDGTPEIQ